MSRGSNLRAMAESFIRDALPVRIAFCVITRRDAPVSGVCRELGIPCHYLPYKKSSVGADSVPISSGGCQSSDFVNGASESTATGVSELRNAALHGFAVTDFQPSHSATFESEVLTLIHSHQIELIALAGFLKLLSASFISQCAIPILNIHPALLPRYGGKGMYGAAVHQAVYKNGDKVSGATVHLVNEHYDQGTILAQERVDISDCQSPLEIAGRVLAVEHRIYAQAIWQVLIAQMGGSQPTSNR